MRANKKDKQGVQDYIKATKLYQVRRGIELRLARLIKMERTA